MSVDAENFKTAFQAAQTFNKLLKEGKTDELVMAPVVEDKEEPAVEENPDENKPHGEDGGDDDKEE